MVEVKAETLTKSWNKKLEKVNVPENDDEDDLPLM